MEKPSVTSDRTGVLFVCMGNICRSPTAEGVFRSVVEKRQLGGRFLIDSAGTIDYHAGSPPDARAIAHAAKRGYDLSSLRARQVAAGDFDRFDFVLAMDKENLQTLQSMSPSRCRQKIELLLEYGHEFGGAEVPDPYYGSAKDFERALMMIEDGCNGLLDFLVSRSGTSA
jgi:protein-tyrosine phosphatase